MLEHLTPNDIRLALRAKQLDQQLRKEWEIKHGFTNKAGQSAPTLASEYRKAMEADPCPDTACIGTLVRMSIGSLEELQTLMYLGRDGVSHLGWDSADWAQVKTCDTWKVALEAFGNINKGNRWVLINNINEKGPLANYLFAAIERLPLSGEWKALLNELQATMERSHDF